MPAIISFPGRAERAATGGADPVRAAYDALAPAYDAFTAGYRHDLWLGEIERIAEAHGLRGKRVLDLACGTGKSFLPLLERGYAVSACDLSPEMARRASRKAPAARVFVADIRHSPGLGAFDLVTCLDDALNCMLERDDLASTLAGIATHLAPHGLAIWDVNTLAMLRSTFSSDWVADRGEWFLAWQGEGSPRRARRRRRGAGRRLPPPRHQWSRTSSRHRQRHWPADEVSAIARQAGLEIVEVLGSTGGYGASTGSTSSATPRRCSSPGSLTPAERLSRRC